MICLFAFLADDDICKPKETDFEHEEVRFVPDSEAVVVQPMSILSKSDSEKETDVEMSAIEHQDADSRGAENMIAYSSNEIGKEGTSEEATSQDSQISVEIEKEFRDYFRKQTDGPIHASKEEGEKESNVEKSLGDSKLAQKAENATKDIGAEISVKPPCKTAVSAEVAVSNGSIMDVKELTSKAEADRKSSDTTGLSAASFGSSAETLGSTKAGGTKEETATEQLPAAGPTGPVAAETKSISNVESKRESDNADVSALQSRPTYLDKKPDDVKGYFKLGMEGSYVMYENQYFSNSLASSKHDHQAERDKRRALGNKFRLYDFKWLGEIYQGPALVVNTLRSTLLSFESSIPTAFLHPMWYRQLPSWIKAVRMCKDVSEFAAMLSVLQRAIKPIIVLNVWRESLGNVSLKRIQFEGKTKKGPRSIRDRDVLDEELDDDDSNEVKPKGNFDFIRCTCVRICVRFTYGNLVTTYFL